MSEVTSLRTEALDSVRRRERWTGYWITTDNPVGTERIARLGYDYVCIDAQHGLLDYQGVLRGIQAIDAGGSAVPMVRVEANDPTYIGKALDAGAWAVIVPLVNSADDAARAVASAKYPPRGVRSYGPMRASLRLGPDPATVDATTGVFVMIETADGLAQVAEIAATPGVDGLYVGPSDLSLAVGAARPGATGDLAAWEPAIEAVTAAAEASGIACGMHCATGEQAAHWLKRGFTFATVSGDLVHLEAVAREHLESARA